MAENIAAFEQQYSLVTAEVVTETNKLAKLVGNEKQQGVKVIERLMTEAKELLEQMEMEIRSVAPLERGKFQNRLQSYNVELMKLEKDYKRARISLGYDAQLRDELFNNGEAQLTEDMRENLLSNAEKLEMSSDRLDTGYRICLETEQIGTQILEDLSGQRTTLQRAKDRLTHTNDELGKSSRVLSAMLRRGLQNRVILILLCVVSVIIISTSIYFIFKPKQSSSSSPPPPSPP